MIGLRREDVDEDFDEASDSDLNDAIRGFGEDDLSERRKVRGRGYTNPKIEKSFVTQQQLTAAMSRVGSDVRQLTTQNSALAKAQTRLRRDTEQNLQMAMLLPMLMGGSTVTTNADVGGIPAGTVLQTGSTDSTMMLLPLLMMGGMGTGFGSSTGSSSSSSMGNNDMMMLVLAMVMMKK